MACHGFVTTFSYKKLDKRENENLVRFTNVKNGFNQEKLELEFM